MSHIKYSNLSLIPVFNSNLFLSRFVGIVLFTCFFSLHSSALLNSPNDLEVLRQKQGSEYSNYLYMYSNFAAFDRNTAFLNKLRNSNDEYGKASNEIFLDYCEVLIKKRVYPNTNHRTIISIVHPFLVKAIEQGDPFLIAEFYYILSESHRVLGEFNKSFEYKLLEYKELEKDPEKRYFNQGWHLHQFASNYYEFSDYKNALIIAQKCDGIRNDSSRYSVWIKKANADLIANSFLKLGNLDSAENRFNQIYRFAMADNDVLWQAIALGDLGKMAYLRKNFSKADSLLRKAIPMCAEGNLWDNFVAFNTVLINVYFDQQQFDRISPLIQAVERNIHKSINQPNYLFNAVNFYKIAYHFFRSTGNATKALLFADSLNKYDSLNNNEFNQLRKIQTEAHLSIKQAELDRSKIERKFFQNKLILGGIIVLLLTVGFIFWKYNKRKTTRLKLRQQKLEHANKIKSQQLTSVKAELDDFSKTVAEKDELIAMFTDQIEELKQQNDVLTDEQLAVLDQIKASVILTEDDWIQFKDLFEKLHPGFFYSLKLKYPNLTPAEIRYIVLSKLQLDNREMCEMLGISQPGLRNIRFRVKKKLEIEDNDEFDQLILTL